MTPLASLRAAGLTLRLAGGKLLVAPLSSLSDEHRLLIVESRAAIVAELAEEADAESFADAVADAPTPWEDGFFEREWVREIAPDGTAGGWSWWPAGYWQEIGRLLMLAAIDRRIAAEEAEAALARAEKKARHKKTRKKKGKPDAAAPQYLGGM